MLKNYFRIAVRTLRKNWFYSGINIAGLSLALTVFVLIGVYISHEISFDRHLPDANRVYRINQESLAAGMSSSAILQPGMGGALRNQFSEVEVLTEIGLPHRALLTTQTESFYVDDALFVDEYFFDIFQTTVIAGDASYSLTQPGNVIITKSEALKLFGSTDIIGEVLTYENQADVTVAAIVNDPPANSHFTYTALFSLFESQRARRSNEILWSYFNGGYVYAKLNENASQDLFLQNLNQFEATLNKPDWMGTAPLLFLQPITSIYLQESLGNAIGAHGNPTLLFIFASIALLLIVLACTNYMNLSSAKAIERSKEVGVRKTFGAQKRELISQFLSEAALLSCIALPLCFLGVEVLLPFINNTLDLQLSLFDRQHLPFLLGVPFIILATGVISGSYSAFYLSSIQAHHAFKNQVLPSKGRMLRRGIMVFQFAASIFLVVCTVTMYRQVDFIQTLNLGFNQDRVITFPTGSLGEHYSTFKSNVQHMAYVEGVTSGPPAGIGYMTILTAVKDQQSGKTEHVVIQEVDYDYEKVLELNITEGQFFSDAPSIHDEHSVVVNASTLSLSKFKGKTIGDEISINGKDKRIIGIVEDFHNGLLYSPIRPLVITLREGNNQTGMIRLSAGSDNEVISEVAKIWGELVPGRPFDFNYLDQRIQAYYDKEQNLLILFSLFTGITVLVAVLGLIGLSAYAAQKRKKEIGIRKTLGASTLRIVHLLYREYTWLVLLGFVLAVPGCIVALNHWLSSFAYKIELRAASFVLALFIIVVISLCAIGIQTLRAAWTNPVNSLKTD
ncbi:MAG: FtsX-like permease family protein [Bacteroidota bacterium]